MHEPLDWVGSDGPLVILSQAFSDSWYGMHRPMEEDEDVEDDEVVEMPDGQLAVICEEVNTDKPQSHYDEVCAALDEVPAALVEVGEFIAVALETSGHQVCWWPLADGGVAAQMLFAESEAEAEDALSGIEFDDLDWEPIDQWELADSGAYLLGATETLDDLHGEVIHLDLSAGTYDLSFTRWEPDESICLYLYRLERQ